MKTFRFKLFASNIVLLAIFLILLFPFISNSVQRIVVKSMSDRAGELIVNISKSLNEKELIQAVKDEAYFVFFHVALIDENKIVLYDSQSKRLLGTSLVKFFQIPVEVQRAFQDGVGFSEEFSPLLGQKLIYLAKSFEFQNKTYVLRLAFPYEYIQELKSSFKIGFLLFSSLALILFSIMAVMIFYHFMGPIRQILHAIKPYQEGRASYIPEIRIRAYFKDEFSDLAKTVNSLSERIKSQVDTLTRERNEKEAILESLAEGVLAVDEEMNISYANVHALGFLDLESTYIGTPFPKHIHPKCYDLLKKCHENMQCLNDEVQISQGGKWRHFNLVASPRQPLGGAILVLQDKSIHYKILEMRKEFIANASHELKTPITIIRGFAETLHDNPDLDKKTVSEITEKIVRNSYRMTKIIKNLLTLSDIENLPRFKVQSVNLGSLVARCATQLKGIYPDAEVVIDSEEPVMAEVDVDLFEVAITNLLDNGAKYSKSGRHLTVILKNEPNNVKIEVKDRGIGIPQGDLEHIFGRFYTVNKAESKKLGGSGLGLSIVDTIVEKHFGSIRCSSVVGEGSTFTIEIPHTISQRLPS